MQKPSWPEYYKKVIQRPHDPRTQKALTFLKGRANVAVDCGCGAGRDAAYLLSQGLHVHAFDQDPEAIRICEERFDGEVAFTLRQASFETFEFPPCDLLLAHNCLFFGSDDLNTLWKRMTDAVKPGGVISADFLGYEDSWVQSPNHDVNPIAETHLRDMLANVEIISFDETNKLGTTALGFEKRWHVYSVMVRC